VLAETALHHGIDPGAPGERYQVVVHVDAAVLADADQAGQSVLGIDSPTASYTSGVRTDGSCPRCRLPPRFRIHARTAMSDWTWAMRSTSCTLSPGRRTLNSRMPSIRRLNVGEAHGRPALLHVGGREQAAEWEGPHELAARKALPGRRS
jgi:hypothetical protein